VLGAAGFEGACYDSRNRVPDGARLMPENTKPMRRWIAKFVTLVMLVPTVGPLALARVVPMEGMHCMRRQLSGAAAPSGAEAALHCHEGMPQRAEQDPGQSSKRSKQGSEESSHAAALSASSEASFRAPDCCGSHDCCRSVAASGRAHLTTIRSSYVSLGIDAAASALAAAHISSALLGADSARAPPRS